MHLWLPLGPKFSGALHGFRGNSVKMYLSFDLDGTIQMSINQ